MNTENLKYPLLVKDDYGTFLNPKNFTFIITKGDIYPYMVVCQETGFCCEFKYKSHAIHEKRNPSFEWYNGYWIDENMPQLFNVLTL